MRLTPCTLVLSLCSVLTAQGTGRSAAITDTGESVVGAASLGTVDLQDTPVTNALAPVLMPGFPLTIPAHSNFRPTRGVVLEDLDGDGMREIIRSGTGSGGATSSVYVWRVNGSSFPGWPVTIQGWGQWVPTVADLDGDGRKEVIVPARGLTSGGLVHVLRSDGSPLPGWPRSLSNANVLNSITAADLDGDGRLELLVGTQVGSGGDMHALRHDGTPFGGSWPRTLDHVAATTAAVGDVDGDGAVEVVFTSYRSLYVVSAAGADKPGFPINMSARVPAANFSYQSPALADLDNDGRLEIIVACHQSGSGVYVFKSDGSQLNGWPKLFSGTWSYCPPTVADLDNDGRPEILCGRAGGTLSAPALYAWNIAGQVMPGFPIVQQGGAEGSPIVVDLDGDGVMEILFDSNLLETATGNGWLHCVRANGSVMAGFPLRPTGFTYLNSATVADVDGDGTYEIAAVTDNTMGSTLIYLWKFTTTAAGRAEWRAYHDGNERRGRYHESDSLVFDGVSNIGQGGRFSLLGTANNQYAILIGAGFGATPIPGIGTLRLDPALPILVLAQRPLSSPLGIANVPLVIPNDPGLVGGVVPFQGLEVGARLTLNNLVWLRIR